MHRTRWKSNWSRGKLKKIEFINDFVVKLGSNKKVRETNDSIKLAISIFKDGSIEIIFILFLIWSKLDRDWCVLIGFGPKWKIINISIISPIHFNFFLKYDRDTYVLFTLKVSGGSIDMYKNDKQITFITLIISFLYKK